MNQGYSAGNQAVWENGWECETCLCSYILFWFPAKSPGKNCFFWSFSYLWEPLIAWFASFCVIASYVSAQSCLCCNLWTSGRKDVTVMAILHRTVPTANTQREFVLGLESHTGAPGTRVSISAQHFYHQYKRWTTTVCVWQKLFALSSSGGHHLKLF